MSTDDIARHLPGFPRSTTAEELARQQGVVPVVPFVDLRADLWETDEELDQFLADIRAARQADLG
ncbi:MAG TPA: hypothetical protein VMU51_17230 [Mycobacteriales bacterium]|nr:hypothetical protein [Mycobacteriales bacterium]